MKLEQFFQDNGVPYEKHTHLVTYTSQRLADVEHVSGYMVAKPVIVKCPSSYAMCVLAAPKHVDLKRVAQALGESAVELADEDDMGRLFPDCELGAEPPVGPMFELKTVMDKQLEDDDYLVMQAGTHKEAIKVRRADWQRLCKPIVAEITAS